MEIKDIIKSRRVELGLTLDDVTRQVDVSAATISRWETGDIKNMRRDRIGKLAKVLGVSPSVIMGWSPESPCMVKEGSAEYQTKHRCLIPVLGRVQAGIPIEAVENIIDYEEISEELARCGDFFGLQVKGNSMEPRFLEGDVVIVKRQSDVETGDIGIVMVDGIDATIKRVVKHESGISLIALNSSYAPKFYTCDEIDKLPVEILGKVIELRGKF